MVELAGPKGHSLPLFDEGLQSPFLESLSLGDEGAFERAREGMQQIADIAAVGGLNQVVASRLHQVKDTEVGHELISCTSIKPTHVKWLLAAERSFVDPVISTLSSPKQEGYKLYANFYLPPASLLRFMGHQLVTQAKNPNYVQTTHNHNVEGIISAVVRHGYAATDYLCQSEEYGETLIRDDKEYWQSWLASTRFRRRKRLYEQGDLLALRANDFHSLDRVRATTLTLALELAPVRNFSVTAKPRGVIRPYLQVEDIFHTNHKPFANMVGVNKPMYERLLTTAMSPERALVIMRLLHTGFQDMYDI